MANKTPNTPNDASLQSTKQMLDELDALMEKMLTLPVNDLDDADTFPPAPVVKETTLSATMTLLEPPSVPPPASKKPTASQPSYQMPESVELPTTTAAEPSPFNPPHFALPAAEASEPEPLRFDMPEPLTNEVVPASVLPKLEPLMKDIAEPPTSLQTQWLYLPLVWVNVGFDHSTLVLGGAGRWMRSEAGRMLLGFSGIALMLAAVVWFLKDWLGWNW
jgi:hypothetical protein